MPWLYTGERIPDEHLDKIPRKLAIVVQPGRKYATGLLRDFGRLMHLLLTERAKTFVERLDPGIHQFFPISFFRKDNGEPMFGGEIYYLFNVCAKAKPTDIFPFEVVRRRLDAGYYDEDPISKSSAREAVDGDLIEDGTIRRISLNFRYINPGKPSLNIRAGFHPPANMFRVPVSVASFGPPFVWETGEDELFVTDRFQTEAKKEKLSGSKCRGPCLEIEA